MHLNHWLIERYRAGANPVLIVDEAQGLEIFTMMSCLPSIRVTRPLTSRLAPPTASHSTPTLKYGRS
jgi:hypothetical protein